MSIRLTQAEIHWIKQKYEAGILTLSWYKTNEENAMLEYLKQNNVTTLQELKLWL